MFIVLLCVVLWRMVSASGQSAREEEPSYSDFMAQVERGNVREVTLYLSPNSYDVEGEWRDPAKKFRVTVFKESAPDLTKELRDKGVLINVKEVTRADWVNFLLTGSTQAAAVIDATKSIPPASPCERKKSSRKLSSCR